MAHPSSSQASHGVGGEVLEGDIPKAITVGGSESGGLASSIRRNSSVSDVKFPMQCILAGLSTSGGACREATLVHGPNGTLVGEDELGNRYYENNDNQIG